MDKKMKSALLVVGVAALAFLLLSFRKKPEVAPVSALSQQEKDVLFNEAMGFRGGTYPDVDPYDGREEFLEKFQMRKEAALKKISELGLQAEFDAYKKIQDELPPRP